MKNRIVSDVWVNHFQTSAYLAPVIAACALPTLPRALLIRHHARLTLAFALCYAYSLLAGWSALKARQHTEPSSAPEGDYNSSASAVVALFFIFYFWFVFTLKSSYPTWQLPAVLAGLYAAAVLPPLAKAESFDVILITASTLIEACLVGLAVALAIGLLLFPRTCRHAFIEDFRSATQAISRLTQTHAELLSHVTTIQSVDVITDEETALVAKIKDSLREFLNNVSQARTNLTVVKQEIAWSKVDNVGLNEMNNSMSELVSLLSGVVSTVEMLHTARQNEASGISNEERKEAEKTPRSGTEEQDARSIYELRRDIFSYSKTLADGNAQVAKQVSDAMNTILRARKAASATANLEKSNTATVSESAEAVDPEKGNGNYVQQSSVQSSALHMSLTRKFLGGRALLKELNPPHQHINSVTYFMAINVRFAGELATM